MAEVRIGSTIVLSTRDAAPDGAPSGRRHRLPAAVALLLATPALAGDKAEIESRMNACVAGIDVDAIGQRAEAFTAADYQARVDELCAGDPEAAPSSPRVEDAFYPHPEGAKMHACLTDIVGANADTTADEICEQ